MNGVGNGLMWGRSCGLNYRLWPGPHQTPVCSTFLRCRARPTNFSLAFWTDLPTFSHLSSVSFPVSKLPLLFPPPISLLIIPSISFSTLSPFLLSCPAVRSLSVVIHLSWLQQLLPLRSCGHFQDFSQSRLQVIGTEQKAETGEARRLLDWEQNEWISPRGQSFIAQSLCSSRL